MSAATMTTQAVPEFRAAGTDLSERRRSGVSIAEAAKQATAGAKPLPMTGYKLDLLSGLVRDLLEQLAA